MLNRIQETKKYIQSITQLNPVVGIVLGSGLGNLAHQIDIEVSIPYSQIPNFPVSTVEGHEGNLIVGKIEGISIVALQGRFHYYEGYSAQECTFPIRLFKSLGIQLLILSNASGGVNSSFQIGDIMIINDHINLLPDNPLRGKNIDELGPRFPDMSAPYSIEYIKKLKTIASRHNITLREGVYAALSGPTYETPAEYAFVKFLGADAVGMSTVPEVIVANHMNIPCVALSVITDLGVSGKIVEISHEEVQEIAARAEPKLTLLIKELVKSVQEPKSELCL
ncbi:MAG: purine-nucleoside phosphorylase [Flavobacteriales bacterium]|nr:purine-nucleoside phosphorylase [Flavobacteriales bacterium]